MPSLLPYLITSNPVHTLSNALAAIIPASCTPLLSLHGWSKLYDELFQSVQHWRLAPSDDAHAYEAPGPGDVRSPCPALNALANHGYLNRSGKDIPASELISSLTSVYHLSLPLAVALVSGGVICCGDFHKGISLDALAAHNKLEHDASLVHDNALPGAKFAPTQVNFALLDELLERYPAGMGIEEFAHARLQRESLQLNAGVPKLNAFHEEIGHGEAGLTWLLMKDATDLVRAETLHQFYGLEMIPDTYTVPVEEISFPKAREASAKIGSIMKNMKKNLMKAVPA
ncbi:Chloroperoxidase [Lentinula raphanica]|nr:Chloroperoxidase [Lentinula raphanica]